MAKAKAKRDIYQEVTDRIVEAIESGNTLPWLKSWKDGKNTAGHMPHNADTGRAYSGINVILLMMTSYSSNGWMTYRQGISRGAQVIKGEKATGITFFKPFKGKDKTTGKDKSFFLIKPYSVFNVEQFDWSGVVPQRDPATGDPLLDDAGEPLYVKVRHPEAPTSPLPSSTHFDELAAAVGCDLRVQGNRACYIPSADQVHMPHHDQFSSTDEYNSTGYHELTHWTGHTSRMDRMKKFTRFGDEAYAFEELVAELGSAFLCAQTGVVAELRHDSYIKGWLKVLKNDSHAIFTASSQARQANELILKLAAPEAAQEAAA